ncbi:MAG: preprotein translocase subunit SecG [Verrucomicrobiales bacterium]
MDIAITILSILHVFVALLLILIVMWQKPRQEGLGTSFGGGMSEQMFGAQATNVLQKGTVWLSIIFFANTIIIAVLMVQQTKAKQASKLLTTPVPAAATAPAVPGLPVPGTPPATSPGAPVDAPVPPPPSPPETPAAPTPGTPAAETPAAPAAPAATPPIEVTPPAAGTPPATDPAAPAPSTPEVPAPSGQQP